MDPAPIPPNSCQDTKVQVQYNSGNFSWNSWQINPVRTLSPGLETDGSSNCQIQMRWPEGGEWGRTNQRWIMKNCHEVSDIIMIRTSSIKQLGKGTFYFCLFLYHSNQKTQSQCKQTYEFKFLSRNLKPFSFLRYVYRFVCDLQSLLGYSADELHSMVELGKLLQQHR